MKLSRDFSMASLAAVLQLWVGGKEREAFAAFDEFSGVPPKLAGVLTFPDDPMPPVPVRTPYGDAWLVRASKHEVRRQTKIPIIAMFMLRLFLHDWREWGQGQQNPLWGPNEQRKGLVSKRQHRRVKRQSYG